jgi:putative nucleotidyltransferase with HDIG domain
LLYVGNQKPISGDEIKLLTAVADIAASAIQRVTFHEQTTHRLHQVQALHAIDQAITSSVDLRLTLQTVLEQVISQLRVDAAAILLLDQSTKILEFAARLGFNTGALRHTHLPLGESYAGRSALERRVIHVPDLSEKPGDFTRAVLLAGEGFVTYHAVPLIAKGQVKGVLELFQRASFRSDPDWQDFLESLATQAAIAIDNAQLFTDLQRSNQELALAYDTTLEGWSRALELRDQETEGHTNRVTDLTLRLSRAMGVNEAELVHVRRGALLHDIGKMGIPDSILLKESPLSTEEWAVMRQHPIYAYKLLSPLPYLRPALDIPYCHHEKWDGSGYPQGLSGEQIPLAARIFAIVDVWDALNSDRPYRPAWSKEKAVRYMRSQAGKHFDPEIVDVFLSLIQK